MVRVSITGLLTVLGTLMLAIGVTAAVPAGAWEPACRATITFQQPCLKDLVALELASPQERVETTRLLDWCGDDQLCRIDVLNGRPAGDAHAELALCEMWAPQFALACKQGVEARQSARGR